MRKFLQSFWRVITFPLRVPGLLFAIPYNGFQKIRGFLMDEQEERPVSEALADSIEMPSALLEHVDALRKHITRMVISLVICVAITFILTPQLMDFLARPIGGISALKAIEVTEPIGMFMRVALLGGFALATPYIAFELWLFAAPGLKPRARFFGLVSIPLVIVFFVGGMAFAYFVLLPPAMTFLLNFMGIQVAPRPASYIDFVTGIMFWIGITFEFPLIIYVLTLMGIIHPRSLLNYWKIAISIIAILAAMITPTVDPINMALVMGPMVLLYFVSIGLGYLAIAGHKRQTGEMA